MEPIRPQITAMHENPFNDFIASITTKHGEENWITVYKNTLINDSGHDEGMYCALVTPEKSEQAMTNISWDITIGAGSPGFSMFYEDGIRVTRYHTNTDEGYLRLVLNRDFHGRKKDYIEILEEFRLFHNLFHDQQIGNYVAFDDSGDELEIIKISEKQVQIRRNNIRTFIAAKQMHLLLYFEVTKHFKDKTNFSADFKDSSLIYKIYSGDSYLKGYASFSRILGKKMIRCDQMESSGIWPFERAKAYQDFVIGGDVDTPKTFTCNPDLLANYFGANPNAPHYLTPVFFRKEVMQKYYSSSDYVISDGRLSRRGAWTLRFDNNSRNHVSVFLGDLGQDLPEKEQLYWKSFNLVPDGRKISRTNFQRSFLGNLFDPENPEHEFKHKFSKLQTQWSDLNGWDLFLPLSEKDQHYFSSIRSMLTNEQSEFDALVLALSKVTIDSINVKELRSYLGISDTEIKSIALVEQLLTKLNASNISRYVELLRGVQSVRSTGVAHRKGTEYDKVIAKLDIDTNDYQVEFDHILCNMIYLIQELSSCIAS